MTSCYVTSRHVVVYFQLAMLSALLDFYLSTENFFYSYDKMAVVPSVVSTGAFTPKANQDSAADNECAEALLQLAMSIATPITPPTKTEHQQRRRSMSSNTTTSVSPKGKHNRPYSAASGSSCVKEECDSSLDCGSGFTEEQEIGNDLVKRIRLDHNYCWPGDEKSRPVEYVSFHNGMASDSLLEKILGDDVGIPPRWNKENAIDAPQKSLNKKSPGRRARPYYGSCPRKNYASSSTQVNKQVYTSYPTSGASSGTNCTSSADKYSKFQLLMECLIANDPSDGKMGYDELSIVGNDAKCNMEVGAINKGKLESEEEDENDSGPFIDVESDLEGDSHYVCPKCPKTFSKRRYLTKHVRRMHPETEIPDMRDEIATACPNCFRVIQRRNFRRHLMVCDVEMSRSKNRHYTDSDLAFCQFCGVQMKRHLLVKHLAKEHCIDRHTIQFDQEFSKFLADEENASMYPSDTSYPMQETSGACSVSQTVEVDKSKDMEVAALIVPCPKCNISISDDLLSRHMVLDHGIIVDNASALAASKCSCKHSMLQAYLDGTTESSGSGSMGGKYPCEACVQNLSTLSEHCSATVSARSSERVALSSPLSGMSSTSPVKSTRGSSSTVSAEETRMQVSLLEDTARTLLKCATMPVAN